MSGKIQMISKLINFVENVKCNKIKFKSRGNKLIIKSKFYIISPDCISIGENFIAEANLKLQAWKEYNGQKFNPSIVIGDNVSIMNDCQISCCSSIVIGNGTLIGPNVFITDNFHGKSQKEELDIPPLLRDLYVKGNVEIGKNVWIGRNVCIMPGVTIGDGAVIGANSVVTSDISAYSVFAGVPARIIKKYDTKL